MIGDLRLGESTLKKSEIGRAVSRLRDALSTEAEVRLSDLESMRARALACANASIANELRPSPETLVELGELLGRVAERLGK